MVASNGARADGPEIDFGRDVQPILRRHCYRCHGPANAEGGFRFSQRESALGLGDSDEPLIVAGKPDESLVVKRLVDDAYGDLMPLDGDPVSPAELAVLRRWISSGASWPDSLAVDQHWAYQKPTRPKLPTMSSQDWVRNDIDRFVLSRIEEAGLSPSPTANKARLLRRVSLALTGLPPSIEEVEAFLKSDSPRAYEEYVDRLLKSPRYGEHWARQWLDLARYADSNGFQADQLRDSWAYRDWVIKALNAGLPFDQFVVEQLAGDLLPNATLEQKIATGFHRTVTCNVEAGVDPEQNRTNQIFDRVNTTGLVFLGTTIECCQCHDHKYDPFTQKEFYQLFAYFNNTPLEVKLASGTQFNFTGPAMELPFAPEQQTRRDELRRELADLRARQTDLRKASQAGFDDWRERVRTALKTNPAKWQPQPIQSFSTTGKETHQFQPDGSVLLTGTVPSTSIYTVRIDGPLEDVLGFKIETLTDDSLPGKGPGRGDATRPNFLLSEFTVAANRAGEDMEEIPLSSPAADFSQKGWNVARAIDGDRKTGWGINPQFHKPHWATFRTTEPIRVNEADSLVLKLDQNYGQGRTIGRLKLAVLVGDELTADLSDEIAALLTQEELTPKQLSQLQEHHSKSNPRLTKVDERVKQIEAQIEKMKPPSTLVMIEMEKQRQTKVFDRGNYLSQREGVECGTPAILHSLDDSFPKNRLGFAKWLVSPDNPLLARVTVNRWWAEIFGKGIVTTTEDFGTQSESPTLPKLLDWLAVEFMESGWSMKHIHKQMVMSATFHQAARRSDLLAKRDPENRFLARGPRFRLSAEAVRDNALAVSGLLSTKMHGPPIMPYQPNGIWRAVGRNQPKWITATNEDRFRRGVYIVWKRSAPYSSFVNFDAPDRASCTTQRPRTNTPLQALTLLNDPAYAEMALALAQRMIVERPDASPLERATFGLRLCVARQATTAEANILAGVYAAELEKLKQDPKLVPDRLSNLLPRLRNADVDSLQLAAWFAVANVLLNLDETMNL